MLHSVLHDVSELHDMLHDVLHSVLHKVLHSVQHGVQHNLSTECIQDVSATAAHFNSQYPNRQELTTYCSIFF